jgi:uncharacterized protein YeaO (DUF488 family)
MAAKKPNDKLSKMDKRIASVAPGKKYSDLTPAEKRKYDTNTARYVAELKKQQTGSAKKSSKETLKSASTKKTTKATANEREFAKDKASRKEMKKEDTFYSKVAKKDLKSGKIGISKSVLSNSQSPSKPKVPVKPRGGSGMRGGIGSFGSGSGLRGSVNK